jgi:hypothetical protein
MWVNRHGDCYDTAAQPEIRAEHNLTRSRSEAPLPSETGDPCLDAGER